MARQLLKITDPALLAPGAHHDGDNLYLDVRSPTSASWVFKFTFGGKSDEVGLGSRKKVDADRARELQTWALAELGAGRSPKVSLKETKLKLIRLANAPKAASVYELARDNVKLIAGPKLKSSRGRKEWVAALHESRIGRIARMDPADVNEEDVMAMLTPYYTGKDVKGNVVREPAPVMADTVRQNLSKLLSWAKATKRITTPDWENPVRWEDNLSRVLDRGEHVEKHHESLPHYRVGAFIHALRARATTSLAMRLALEWHVISATRPGEACGAAWNEFDWANDCWVIPAERMKMRRPHRVPLTARHHAILDLLLAGDEPPTEGPLFSAYGDAAVSVTGLRRVMQAVRPTGCTLHGFRSSFGTWARAETYPVTLPNGESRMIRLYDEAMIEESLAHMVGGAVRGAYVRDDFLEIRRPLLEAWAEFCGKLPVATGVAEPVRRRAAMAA